jgi:hypothetical protein
MNSSVRVGENKLTEIEGSDLFCHHLNLKQKFI